MESIIEITDNFELKRKLVRPAIAVFALEMERIMADNDDKDGWDEMEVNSIVKRIHEEVFELQEYLTLYNHPQDDTCKVREIRLEQIHNEAIDIANFCMFLCHNYPIKKEPKESD